MSDLSVVSKRRDYSDIVKLQEVGVLEDFLDEPLTFIAETLTGVLAAGRTGMTVAGGRIVQGVLKGKLFKQWGAEFKKLRDSNRIPEDFAETTYGFQTWVELMTIIDEDSPDPDRMEALKAVFFSVNKVNATDGERIAAYQLWQIAKNLSSGELLLLKIIYEHKEKLHSNRNGYSGWASSVAQLMGHGVIGLIDLHEKKLTELYLLSARQFSDQSGINSTNGRLTDLGISFCKNIETYKAEINTAE